MNASWETTARLMGDSWVKTILRVVTPNAWPTILQVFGYYFVSSMVTISAVVFLVGARTMVVTTRISALQHIAEFDGIFALSLVILVVNMLVKGLVALACRDRSARSVHTSVRMRGTGRSDALEAEVLLGRPDRMPARRMAGALLIVSVVAVVGIGASLAARERGEDDGAGVPSGQVVIASNGDAEAVEAYRHTLDAAGFEGDYIVQSFGTSELGGKLMAEGENLEADIVTMSSYYVDSAQTEQDMFVPLTELELCPLDPNVPVHGVSQPRGARRARRAQRGEGGRYGLGHSGGPVRRRPLDRRGGRQLGDGGSRRRSMRRSIPRGRTRRASARRACCVRRGLRTWFAICPSCRGCSGCRPNLCACAVGPAWAEEGSADSRRCGRLSCKGESRGCTFGFAWAAG